MSQPIRDMLAATVMQELHNIGHLYTKIPPGAMDYRPTPGQRSVLELLRYLGGVGLATARMHLTDDWASYREIMDPLKEMSADEFPAKMEEQRIGLEATFASLTDADLLQKRSKLVTGDEVPILHAMMETTLKWLTAYRMQLFLYVKQAGNEEIDTANNWVGKDRKKD